MKKSKFLKAKKDILIVVDMQNDFINGSLGTKEAEAIVPNVVAKIKKYQEENNYILTTQDTHNPYYLQTPEGKKLPVEHCIYGSDGWQLHKDIDDAIGTYPTVCIFKGTFGTKKLEECLKNAQKHFDITHIELVGLCTDICVVSNALMLKAAFPDIEISVDSSCCAGVTPELHQAALDVMKSCQIDIT